MPSAYQLLPIYQMVETDAGWMRPAELQFPEVDQVLAIDGLSFHREIEAAVASNRKEEGYNTGFTTLPFVGARQPTLQSATWSESVLRPSRSVPKGVDDLLTGGDGTVPRLSAIPIEMSSEYRDTFVPERHAGLHNNRAVLQDVRERLIQMQTRGLASIRGPEPVSGDKPALSVDVDDVYERDEQVIVHARVLDGAAAGLVAAVTPLEGSTPSRWNFEQADDGFSADLTGIAAGIYRIEVSSISGGQASPAPVSDVFAVASA